MTDRNNPAVIIRYLCDLDEIMIEHAKSCESCEIDVNTDIVAFKDVCTYISVISVEIMTEQHKLAKIARIV